MNVWTMWPWRNRQPENPGRALAAIRIDKDRARRRAMVDQMRADMRAKGKDMPAIDWSAL